MAGEKTEKPTDKRISDAREKGQVAKSPDFNSAVVLTAAAATMSFAGPAAFSSLYGMMKQTFGSTMASAIALKPMSDTTFDGLWFSTLQSSIILMMPMLAAAMVVGVLANLAQVRVLFAPQAIMPKLDKINPMGGFKRLFSQRSLMEVLKATVRMTIVGWAGYATITKHWPTLMGLGGVEPLVAWQGIFGILGEVTQTSCMWLLITGAADWKWQSYQLEKQLMMSKQDIKEERKSSDGDPMIKNKIKQMGLKFARGRQLASVPTSDVVITNPTHYAIAIKYDPDVAPAPIVVAKGKDLFAQKIKEMAKEHGVPMVENKPLARALYPVVEAETMIPPDLFVAVAEVLAYVFAKNKGRRLATQKRQKEEREEKERKKEDLKRRREESDRLENDGGSSE